MNAGLEPAYLPQLIEVLEKRLSIDFSHVCPVAANVVPA
jgi:hypothetical protein